MCIWHLSFQGLACFIQMCATPARRNRPSCLLQRDVAKLEALEARMDAMGKRLTVLKETLYGRFGKAINLEE